MAPFSTSKDKHSFNAIRVIAERAFLMKTWPACCKSLMYEGRSISSRTVLIKHKVNVENRNYYNVVPSLIYITYRGFIYDVMLWRHYYEEINNGCWSLAVTGNNNQILVAKVAESAEIYHRLSAVCKSETLVRWDMGSSSCARKPMVIGAVEARVFTKP